MTDEIEIENRSQVCKEECVFCERLNICMWILEPGVCPKKDEEYDDENKDISLALRS